ncbi:MAG TPA: hypothetical protein VJT31_14710 [Rugosimonospora sp.]|nr:hypothetical protein [Rugosimonospora sp.]
MTTSHLTTHHTPIPDTVHDLIDWLTEVAFHQGYQAALHDIATRHAELDEAWKPIGRRSHEQQVAARIAEMEQHAQQRRARLDRAARRADRPHRGRRDHVAGSDDWPPVATPGHPPPPAA